MNQSWDRLKTSAPVNKAAAVVTNQHNVSDKVALNLLVDERRVLRANVRAWTAESITASQKRLKELRPIMRAAAKRLAELNQIMRDNPDAKVASRFSTVHQAYVAVAREVLPSNVHSEIMSRAKEAMKV